MQKLTAKDKKMLIVLIVFLFAVGYYEFIVSPLYNMSMRTDSSIVKDKKQLLILKTKLGGLNNYKKKYNDLIEIIKIAEKSVIMPDVTVQLDTKIKAIMTAADIASVSIRSIKPMNYIKEGSKGEPIIIKDKFFSIEGTASVERFMKFIRGLWGTKLESVNLQTMDKSGGEIRYFIKIEFLNKVKSDIDNEKNLKDYPKYKAFNLEHNPFTIIKPSPPPRPKKVEREEPKEPPKIVHTLSNFELIGIAEFNKEKMAIINDKEKNKVIYLLKGDSFRESIVKSIKNKEVAFYFADNKQTIVEKLKDTGLKLKSSTTPPNNKDKRKGHLGIMVETFTQDIANRYHVEFNPGLFVVSPGRHRNIFKKGDVILEINGQPVPNFEAALRVMNNVYVGDKLKIIFKRDGKSKTLSYNAD